MQEAGESGCDQQNSRQIVHRNLSGEISGKRNSICVSRVRRTLRRGGGAVRAQIGTPFRETRVSRSSPDVEFDGEVRSGRCPEKFDESHGRPSL